MEFQLGKLQFYCCSHVSCILFLCIQLLTSIYFACILFQNSPKSMSKFIHGEMYSTIGRQHMVVLPESWWPKLTQTSASRCDITRAMTAVKDVKALDLMREYFSLKFKRFFLHPSSAHSVQLSPDKRSKSCIDSQRFRSYHKQMARVYASWCDSKLGGKFPPLRHKNMWQMQKSENWI